MGNVKQIKGMSSRLEKEGEGCWGGGGGNFKLPLSEICWLINTGYIACDENIYYRI